MGKSTTVNLLIIDLLEDLYADTTKFNYSAALMTLVKEAEAYAVNHKNKTEFAIVELDSFSNICVAQAENAKLRPSMVRAQLGKMFNSLVRGGNISGISRAKDINGSNIFINKTAVYVVNKDKEGK